MNAAPRPPEARDAPASGVVARLSRLFLSREFLRFLISGGLAALVNFATGFAIRSGLGPSTHAASVFAGFVAGTVVSFFLNKYFTFRGNADPVAVQAVKFTLVALLGIAIATGVAELVYFTGAHLAHGRISERTLGSLAHVASIGFTTFVNFVTMKFYALRARKASQ